MLAGWSKSGIEYSLSFVSRVGELCTLLVRFLSLRCTVDVLPLLSRSLSGEIFCGVGIRCGDDEVSALSSVTGEFACRFPSSLPITDGLFPILSGIGYGDGPKALSEERIVADVE